MCIRDSGYTFTEQTPITFERFEVVEVFNK